jgi:rod shape-determining protein RodA
MDRWRWLGRIDWLLLAAALVLVAIGLTAIDAATESVPGAGPIERQLVWAGIAVVAMAIAAWPSYRLAERLAYAAFVLCVPLLVVVFWTEPVNGAQRWLRAGPIGLQPSELAKLAFVAALARFLTRGENSRRWWVLIVPPVLAALPMALILKQPDLGTALLFVPVLLAMLFGAGVKFRYLAALVLTGVVAAPFLWKAMSPTQRSRITGFLEQRDTGPRPRDEGYQLYQSKLMVALGGTAGSSDATELHLPFDHTDFIFSVVAGRWGLTGVTGVLAAFAVVVWRGLVIAGRSPDPFGRLFALGLVTLLSTQALTNMAMTVGLAPITGLTLPFVSYGGSSLLACFVAVGILQNISLERADESCVTGLTSAYR